MAPPCEGPRPLVLAKSLFARVRARFGARSFALERDRGLVRHTYDCFDSCCGLEWGGGGAIVRAPLAILSCLCLGAHIFVVVSAVTLVCASGANGGCG